MVVIGLGNLKLSPNGVYGMVAPGPNALSGILSKGFTTLAITFANAFYATPSLGIAAQNMATGDYFTISSKSATGFSIAFLNSSASGVDRTFDYVAKGYGLTP